jgi:23S rRNA (pseudouridine1915-N3)-methyltransferase
MVILTTQARLGQEPELSFGLGLEQGEHISPRCRAGSWVTTLLHIRVVSVGKVKNRFIADGIEEYRKRISPFARLELLDLKQSFSRDSRRSKALQGTALISRAKSGLSVALHPEGREVSSQELAGLLRGREAVDFLIGGPEGLSDEVIESSDLSLSLSRLTFTREFAKLILVEQIYRALTIMNNRPYHK